ncbi:MAG: L-histidine N(alpha)-methyltransferase [Candidatus Sericytochromatia bacterium]
MEFNQKYLYLGECAELYYKSDIYQKTDNSIIKFVKNFINNYSIEHFISLGCGNSYEEKKIIFKLKKSIKYTGVDFSEKMLELSKKTLDKSKLKNYELINDDFLNTKIESKISPRLYYFSGLTMCNFDTNEWIKIINLMSSKDYLIFYVISVPDPFITKEIIINSVENICNDKIKKQQYIEALKILQLDNYEGDFTQEFTEDQLSIIIRYIFNPKFGKSFKVQDVRIFSIPKLIEFFQENNCKFIKKKIHIDTCAYVFQKN